jgi:hypothetical protein
VSICRIIPGHSDVYMYEHCDGYVHCCLCRLAEDCKMHSDDEAVAHLSVHKEMGHLVPDYAFEYFKKPAEQRQ